MGPTAHRPPAVVAMGGSATWRGRRQAAGKPAAAVPEIEATSPAPAGVCARGHAPYVPMIDAISSCRSIASKNISSGDSAHSAQCSLPGGKERKGKERKSAAGLPRAARRRRAPCVGHPLSAGWRIDRSAATSLCVCTRVGRAGGRSPCVVRVAVESRRLAMRLALELVAQRDAERRLEDAKPVRAFPTLTHIYCNTLAPSLQHFAHLLQRCCYLSIAYSTAAARGTARCTGLCAVGRWGGMRMPSRAEKARRGRLRPGGGLRRSVL
jgi:hypothetical protein